MTNLRSPLGLTKEQIDTFQEDGFLVVDSVLNDDDLAPLEQEYASLLDDIADEMVEAGHIPDAFNTLPFGERYSTIIALYPALHYRFNISLPLINGPVDPSMYHVHSGPAVFGLQRNPKILDVVESILGPEIWSSPVQQMRMKPPVKRVAAGLAGHSNVGATTWHQDIVALLPEADDTQVVTVWVAVTDATIENGCLVSVPGSHREGPKVHCSNMELASEPHVPGKLMENREARPLPVKRGGIILFHKMNIHRALPNTSNALRWSVDLRYNPIGQPSGRPAFPGFVARSRANPASELTDAQVWADNWEKARQVIVSGGWHDRVFEDTRWNDAAAC